MRSGPTDGGTLLGLDLGASKTLGIVVGPDGTVLAHAREPTQPGAEGVLRTALRVLEMLRTGTGRTAVALGVGMPGLVDHERGVVNHAVNLGIHGDWELGAQLSEQLGLPVHLDNDANAAALGASAVLGEDDVVLVSLGSGIAAGLVLEGRLRRGHSLAAGEIGHLPVEVDGAPCPCGQRGCLETFASGSALASAWPTEGSPPAQRLFAAAQAGDAAAIRVRDRFAAGVAAAVRILALTSDPRTVVLGGGIASLGEPLRRAVTRALDDQAASSPFLASLDLAGRLRMLPSDVPVAALGAALLGRDGHRTGARGGAS